MNRKDPLAQYRRLSVESQVEQASPHRLIELLFDSAIMRLKQAQQALACGDISEKGRLLGRVQEILATLRSSLSISEQRTDTSIDEQELPLNLDALYDYCQRRLLKANIDNDSAGLLEAQQLLATVQEAWQGIDPS